jgi:Uncharacterized protein conserved in bacteria (DUF2252)
MARSVAQSILDDNRGREPERLRRKFQLLRADPYAFYRGTCALFYRNLPRNAVLAAAPALLVCGDMHLENFDTYKGDNRLAYFDLNDFDEAALAPFTLDLLRFVGSIHVAASHLRLSTRQAEGLGGLFLDRYRQWILDGKARWLERSTAKGMVRDLLMGVIKRTRHQLLRARTVRAGAGRRLRLNERALPIAKEERPAHIRHRAFRRGARRTTLLSPTRRGAACCRQGKPGARTLRAAGGRQGLGTGQLCCHSEHEAWSKRMRVELCPPDSDTEPRHWVRHDQAFAMMLRPGSIEWGSKRSALEKFDSRVAGHFLVNVQACPESVTHRSLCPPQHCVLRQQF